MKIITLSFYVVTGFDSAMLVSFEAAIYGVVILLYIAESFCFCPDPVDYEGCFSF